MFKKNKKIIHIDMDYFFAQVEERDNPSLKNVPVGIGGIMNGRGVLCTSNYIARKYGVRAAMPTALALKKCPSLVLVKPNMKKYMKVSEEIFDVYIQFTKKIQRLSLDEAYLDVTDCKKFDNNAIAIAKEIKKRIYGKTKLTASAGISYNKLLAKIGSDLFKPNGMAILRQNNIEQNISHFSVSKIWGVGKVTQTKMTSMGIHTFGDLQKYSKLDLINHFGTFGVDLFHYSRGVDEREVANESERKSLSVEHTFQEDYSEEHILKEKFFQAFCELENRIEEKFNQKIDKRFRNIFVKIKYADFTTTTIEAPLDFSYDNFEHLFLKRFRERPEKIRLLGAGVKFFVSESNCQLSLPL